MKTPFLWSGSKDRDFKFIKSYIPRFEAYHEPFLGGGAVYFRLLAERGSFPAFCTDVHEDLIITYEVMRDDPEGLIALLPETKDRETFDALLASEPMDKTERAARFLYLNRNRFFGLGGWMNADRYARDAIISRIRFFHPLMQESHFSADGCFTFDIGEGDFAFCDPPYPDTNNLACYRIDQDIAQLSITFYDHLYQSECAFLWITKFSPSFEQHATRSDVMVERRSWTYRKPGQAVQQDFELYASR